MFTLLFLKYKRKCSEADVSSSISPLPLPTTRSIKSLAMVGLEHWSPVEQPLRKQVSRDDSSCVVLPWGFLLSFTSGQRSYFKHQIDNRSPEIDPFWYVGRGVRPIGRFGKRQLKFGRNNLRSRSRNLELILTALQKQAALEADDDGW
ncbi:prolactin-releasing peptide-like [Podarcis lilfordi]|uniref:Prolactin-releasing peptide-like n=1 Tax=Podarcis lilfordi TaxID=74358 RepID=A0AA35L1N4_9SAUR|nr:prolactin-releasing peptide-like [Podarcis lilfordi]